MDVFLVLSVLGISVSARNTAILDMYKQYYSGDGTYYWPGKDGTCSYPPPDLPPAARHSSITDLVALNRPQFHKSLACGMCFKVRGSGVGAGHDPITGEHMVFVKDMCPNCRSGAVDFAKYGDGRWQISIRAVQCPVGDTKLEYKFQGSNNYYLKLQVRNARIPATTVEMLQTRGRWARMKHTTDGFWTMGAKFDRPVSYPINLRLTAANGETIQDQLQMNRLVNEVVIYGTGTGQQFSLDETLP